MRKQQHTFSSKLLTVLFILLTLPTTIFMVQHVERMQGAASSVHYTIYEGALASGWHAQPSASRINLANTSPAYSGSKSISFTPTRKGARLYLYTNTAIDTTLYSFFHFAARASQAGQDYNVVLYSGTSKPLSAVRLAHYGGDPTTRTWKVYNIPLSDLGANATQIRGVAIQSRTRKHGTLYLDSISLTGSVSSSTSKATATPTPTLTLGAAPAAVGRYLSSKLTWAPPPCGDATYACATYQITENSQGHQFLDLDTSKDWIVKLPSNRPQRGGIDINGGHNVIIIGGEIDLTTPCTTDNNVCHGINISRNQNATGEVYIEGVLIKNPDGTHSQYTGDGIDVNTDARPNITLQNIRVEGIDGCGYNGNPAHADVFQPYGAKNTDINVDHFTGTSDFQGMQIDPDTSTPHSGTYKNVNITILSNSHSGCTGSAQYGWWLANACKTYPMTLSNDYEQEPNKSLAYNAVWPDTDTTFGCPAQYTNGIASWPGLSNVHGSIINGLPPSGDFVPAGSVGIGYVSPGYLT